MRSTQFAISQHCSLSRLQTQAIRSLTITALTTMTFEFKLAIVAVAVTIATTLFVLRGCPVITHALYGQPRELLVAPPGYCAGYPPG